MSKKIKLILTLGVIMVGALSVWLEATFADPTVAKVIAGLGCDYDCCTLAVS